MNDYEICPTCGSSLDIGEKCSFCNPLITPIPKVVIPESYKQVNNNKKEGN